jgi:hypothetical protein
MAILPSPSRFKTRAMPGASREVELEDIAAPVRHSAACDVSTSDISYYRHIGLAVWSASTVLMASAENDLIANRPQFSAASPKL